MRNRIHTVIAALVALIAMIVISGCTSNDAGKGSLKESITACEYEDGSTQKACYWDADKRGNGTGASYWIYDYGKRVVYDR